MEVLNLKIANLETILSRLDEEIKENKKSHTTIYDRITALERGSDITSYQYMQIMEMLKEMKDSMKSFQTDIEEIKEQPGKNYNLIIGVTVTAIVGGTIAFMLGKILGGG